MGAPLAVVSPFHHHQQQQQQQEAVATRAAAIVRRRGEKPTMAATRAGVIKLEVYADILCPWCYIEKHSLEEVMERYRGQHPEVQFEVTWKPFYIHPMLKKGIDKRTVYENLNRQFQTFLTRIQAAGARHDIAFSLRGQTGHTRSAHKLIALALQDLGPKAQAHVVEQLFQGHFEDGRDVTDEAWLASLGAAAGIPEAVVHLDLDDEDASRRIDALAEEAREVRGVEAVPCVMVQGKYKVGGYQEGHVFEGLFEKMRLAGEF